MDARWADFELGQVRNADARFWQIWYTQQEFGENVWLNDIYGHHVYETAIISPPKCVFVRTQPRPGPVICGSQL